MVALCLSFPPRMRLGAPPGQRRGASINELSLGVALGTDSSPQPGSDSSFPPGPCVRNGKLSVVSVCVRACVCAKVCLSSSLPTRRAERHQERGGGRIPVFQIQAQQRCCLTGKRRSPPTPLQDGVSFSTSGKAQESPLPFPLTGLLSQLHQRGVEADKMFQVRSSEMDNTRPMSNGGSSREMVLKKTNWMLCSRQECNTHNMRRHSPKGPDSL